MTCVKPGVETENTDWAPTVLLPYSLINECVWSESRGIFKKQRGEKTGEEIIATCSPYKTCGAQ